MPDSVSLATAAPRRDTDPDITKAFVSYARRDLSRVDAVVRELRWRGVECWLDRRNISGGDVWQREVFNALNSCGSVIVFLSQNSARSDSWVHNELSYALELGTKLIVPVHLSPADVRLGEIELATARLQRISGHGRRPEAIAEEIAAALRAGKAVPFPRMSWIGRLFFFGSRRSRADLGKVGNAENLQSNPVVPCDPPLPLFPQYVDIRLDNEKTPCTIIVGQAGVGKSVLISQLVDCSRSSLPFIFGFAASETERIFGSPAGATINLWSALTIKMLERRQSYGLATSTRKFAGKDFLNLLRKSKILLIFEDLHLLSFELSAITRGLLEFCQECRIPASNLRVLASSRREPDLADPWLGQHSRTVSLPVLPDITDASAASARAGMAAQEVLWTLCQKAGHDPAALVNHREVFAQPLSSAALRTPLFLALTALISSPAGENLPLDRSLKLRTAELVEFYLRVLIDRSPAIDFGSLLSDPEIAEPAENIQRFLLILVLEGIRGRRLADVALSLARTRQMNQSAVESAVDKLITGGLLVRTRTRADLRLPHDAVGEYLLAWGFVRKHIEDYEAWRGRCRNRYESLAEMLLGLLGPDDWQLLAYENLPLATAVLLAECRERRSGRQSPWAVGLNEPKLGDFLARWASNGIPFDLDAAGWHTVEDTLDSLGAKRWQPAFIDAIRGVGPSRPGARALLETEVGQSSELLSRWLKMESGQLAVAGALAWPRSRMGFLSRVVRGKLVPQDVSNLVQCWCAAKKLDAGPVEFQIDLESSLRKLIRSLTEAELKIVFDALSLDQACFVARLHEADAHDVRTRIGRAYARAEKAHRPSILLCPGKYRVQQGTTVTIANPIVIPVGYESVAQGNRELDVRNRLVDLARKFDLLTWEELLAAREVGSSGAFLLPDPNIAVEAIKADSFPNKVNFVRHGAASRSVASDKYGALTVSPGTGGADGYDFFEGRLTTVYARSVIRPKSSIQPASKTF